jgi:hypothetical protein
MFNLEQKEENCWICEAWVEADFQLTLLDEKNVPEAVLPEITDPPTPARLYLHCDVD